MVGEGEKVDDDMERRMILTYGDAHVDEIMWVWVNDVMGGSG